MYHHPRHPNTPYPNAPKQTSALKVVLIVVAILFGSAFAGCMSCAACANHMANKGAAARMAAEDAGHP